MSKKIIIFDTTLRDGEQSLQKSLNVKKKIKIAYALEKLGVDIMEVGFPISSPGDFKSVQEISRVIKDSCICSLARCIKKDIDVAAKSMYYSKRFRIHIFLGTSDLHIKYKLRKNFFEIIEMAVSSVKYALKFTDDVEFSCEDAGRTSLDNLCKIIEKVIHAGAKTINIPDTVGYTLPNEFSNIIQYIKLKVPNIHKAIISVHCHNDLGLALGNSISAIQSGARQIEGTINGIGERAGNTALEELILAIKIKKNILNVYTDIKYKRIYKTSKIVSKLCNLSISLYKPIVGLNAFSHSSGIHQDGILKNRENYEIINPKFIGLKKKKLNLTSRSGRSAVKNRMNTMGYSNLDYDIEKLYSNFIKLADKKGQIFDYELEHLSFIKKKKYKKYKKYFKLKNFNFNLNISGVSVVSIELFCGKIIKKNISTNENGLIYTIFKSIKKIVKFSIFLKKFKLILNKKIIKSLIIVKYKKHYFNNYNKDNNIIKSVIKSIINVLNDIWIYKKVLIKLNKNI
ncbi:2-isopropylmalate synthase [Buchnera aphidicola]|uniref:2-isopropylmalate synthase n=1 Tax=Buchnera aphidicola TaxID=9 RepID=UPI0031B7FB0E